MPQLQRYSSKELSHFVGRGKSNDDQFRLLIHIIKTGWLLSSPFESHNSGNLQIKDLNTVSTNDMVNPQMICFCDIPSQDLEIHTNKYSKFGISFSKDFVVEKGGTPVFYIPRSSRVIADHNPKGKLKDHKDAKPILNGLRLSVPQGVYFDHIMPKLFDIINPMKPPQSLQDLVTMHTRDLGEGMEPFQFFNFRILSYFKFFDHELSDEDPDNYYLEREWRVLDNIQFTINDISRIYIQSKYAKQLRHELPEYFGQISFLD